MLNRVITRSGFLAAGLSLFAVAGLASAAAAPATKPAAAAGPSKEEIAKNTFLEPDKATPDYAVQGEYVGEFDAGDGKKMKFAAQVASVGNGKFNAAFYLGGLPGDGADLKSRTEYTGVAADASCKEVAFTPTSSDKAPPLSWANGVLSAKGMDAALKKVERVSPTMGAKPPEGATVLFDGTNTDAWEGGKMDDRKLLMVGAKTKKQYKNFTLHAEFRLPFKPLGRDQDRGNSGIYIQERYEVQVLDSFGEKPVFNGTGALYRQTPPDLNMCLPPLAWQTYDIDFTSPEFDADGKKTKNAVITVKLNGVVVHDKRELPSKTGAGKAETPQPGNILLQAHGNPVAYRNVWIVEK